MLLCSCADRTHRVSDAFGIQHFRNSFATPTNNPMAIPAATTSQDTRDHSITIRNRHARIIDLVPQTLLYPSTRHDTGAGTNVNHTTLHAYRHGNHHMHSTPGPPTAPTATGRTSPQPRNQDTSVHQAAYCTMQQRSPIEDAWHCEQ